MALKTAVLYPGDCIVLPEGTTINSVIVNGSISASSTCNNLPEPTTYMCGYFFIILDASTNESSMDMDSQYTSVTVGSNTYMINEPILLGDDNSPTPTAIGTINLHIPDTPIFEFTSISQNELTDRIHIFVHCRVPESLFDTVKLKVRNNADQAGDGSYSYSFYELIEEEC